MTYSVRRDFVRALKQRARKDGRRLGDVVDEALNRHIFDSQPYYDYGPKESHAYIVKRQTIPKVKAQAFTEKKTISYVVNRALERYFWKIREVSMPFENKKLARTWRITFIDCIERGGEFPIMAKFQVIFPDGKERSIRPIFSEEFIEDYFNPRNIYTEGSRIIKERKELFKEWGLVRIEENIDNGFFEREPNVTRKDFEWAEKIEKGRLQPSSKQQNIDSYIYTLNEG